MGTHFFNYKQASKQPAPTDPTDNYTCQCHLIQYKNFLNHHKHIDTNNTAIITTINKKLTELEKIANYGAGYIPTPKITHSTFEKYFQKDLEDYIQRLAIATRTEPNMFDEWKTHVFTNYSQFIKNEKTNTNHKHHNIPILRSHLKEIHKTITITPTDKMKNNYRFTCSQYYQRILYQKITSKTTLLNNQNLTTKQMEPEKTKAYQLLTKTPQQILKTQEQFLKNNHIPMGPHQLPYIYPIFKCHKNNSRGVTAAYNIITSPLCKILHTVLKLLLQTQLQHNNAKYLTNNINTTWRIENSTDLINKLHNLNKNTQHTPKTLQTFDIEGFYDNIDIPEMENIIRTFVPKTFKLANKKFITLTNRLKTAKWTNEYNPYVFTLEAHTIIHLQIWQLNNAVITYNNKAYQQIKGIAQGSNQSPDLADIILNHYEENFIKHHHKNNNNNILKAFENTYRKMDDILCINNPLTQQWLYQDNDQPHGIYPKKYFTITTDTKDPQPTANYLDTTISIIKTPTHLQQTKTSKYHQYSLHELRTLAKNKKLVQHGHKNELIERLEKHENQHTNYQFPKPTIWDTKTYNKTDKFPIQSINFPHITSNTHHNIKTGSILGRLHSFTLTNMYNKQNYTDNVGKLFVKLITKNQYKYTKLIDTLDKFLSKAKNKNLYNTNKQILINSVCVYLGSNLPK